MWKLFLCYKFLVLFEWQAPICLMFVSCRMWFNFVLTSFVTRMHIFVGLFNLLVTQSFSFTVCFSFHFYFISSILKDDSVFGSHLYNNMVQTDNRKVSYTSSIELMLNYYIFPKRFESLSYFQWCSEFQKIEQHIISYFAINI